MLIASETISVDIVLVPIVYSKIIIVGKKGSSENNYFLFFLASISFKNLSNMVSYNELYL